MGQPRTGRSGAILHWKDGRITQSTAESTSLEGRCKPARAGRVPVLVAVSPGVSGVVSWALRLHRALEDHPGYEILLLWCRAQEPPPGRPGLAAPCREDAYRVLSAVGCGIVVPNAAFDLLDICGELNRLGHGLSCVGFCRSDSEEEYYAPLEYYEPLISQFVAVSPECAQELSRRLPHRTGDIATVPSGVFVPERLDRSYRTQPIRIAYGGRIAQRQKRVMDLVPLVERLIERKLDFVFDVAGDGPDLPALTRAMQGVAHGGRVRFLGRLTPEEMDHFWAEHEVFVQTSDYEGTSNSMLEAMAHGVVPVVTDAGSGIAGTIDAGRNGHAVPVGDMDRMADVLAELAANAERLREMGAAAHGSAGRFSMKSCAARFVEVLDRAAGGPVRTWPGGLAPEPRVRLRIPLPSVEQRARVQDERIAGLERRLDALEVTYRHFLGLPPARLWRWVKRQLGRAFGRREPGGDAT